MSAIEEQTERLVKRSDLTHSTCDHPRCGFHGDFVVLPDRIVAIRHKTAAADGGGDDSCCGSGSGQVSREALQNRKFVSRRWKRPNSDGAGQNDGFHSPLTLDEFASRVKTHGFTVTGMAFQDRWTLDIARLRRCSLHVCEPDSGKIVPFCSYYNRAMDNEQWTIDN
jgi:hypothetical protein